MKLGIDFKAVATKAAGHAAGAAIYTQFNKLKFMNNPDATKALSPLKKGLISAAVGYIGIPLIASKLKLGGKKNDLIQYAGEGMGMVGIMQAAGAQFPAKDGKPGLFPTISGVDDDDISPIYGLGDLEELENVSGYEQNPAVGNDASGNFYDAD